MESTQKAFISVFEKVQENIGIQEMFFKEGTIFIT